MFDDICMTDYNLKFELQKSYFLRDCLYEKISYELKESNVIIYKKLDSGISAEITLDELIFYIHIDIADELKEFQRNADLRAYAPPCPKSVFCNLFSSIDSIKKTVENMIDLVLERIC